MLCVIHITGFYKEDYAEQEYYPALGSSDLSCHLGVECRMSLVRILIIGINELSKK